MPHAPRLVIPGWPHHVTQRGNEGQRTFVSDDDYLNYLRLLLHRCPSEGAQILGFCLMPNHVHLVLAPEAPESLARVMAPVQNDYARHFHLVHGGAGHLWQGRYYSCPLETNHLWKALRYVELNPVRAGLVRTAKDWRWSSARAHCGLIEAGKHLDLSYWATRWTTEQWAEVLREGSRGDDFDDRLRRSTRRGKLLTVSGAASA